MNLGLVLIKGLRGVLPASTALFKSMYVCSMHAWMYVGMYVCMCVCMNTM